MHVLAGSLWNTVRKIKNKKLDANTQNLKMLAILFNQLINMVRILMGNIV